jgi:hypothetical protein
MRIREIDKLSETTGNNDCDNSENKKVKTFYNCHMLSCMKIVKGEVRVYNCTDCMQKYSSGPAEERDCAEIFINLNYTFYTHIYI